MDRHVKSLCLLCYPGKDGQEEYFKVLVEARNILMDPETRLIYNTRALDAAKDVLRHKMFIQTVSEMLNKYSPLKRAKRGKVIS